MEKSNIIDDGAVYIEPRTYCQDRVERDILKKITSRNESVENPRRCYEGYT